MFPNSKKYLNEDTIIDNCWTLINHLGQGSFGEVFLAESRTDRKRVAIKFESIKLKKPLLHNEYIAYMDLVGGQGIPVVFWYGLEEANKCYNALVMELLGPSLRDLFLFCKRRFCLSTVLRLADQMLSTLEFVHSKGFVHGDIKPENFAIGAEKKSNQIFLIDFGFARKYIDCRTGEHDEKNSNAEFTGSPKYASVNIHRGNESSRRDDLESLGYTLINFMKAKLPWDGVTLSSSKHRLEETVRRKLSTSPEKLCKKLPVEFLTYINYCRSLEYTSAPDHDKCRQLFGDLFKNKRFSYNSKFDWCLKQK